MIFASLQQLDFRIIWHFVTEITIYNVQDDRIITCSVQLFRSEHLKDFKFVKSHLCTYSNVFIWLKEDNFVQGSLL